MAFLMFFSSRFLVFWGRSCTSFQWEHSPQIRKQMDCWAKFISIFLYEFPSLALYGKMPLPLVDCLHHLHALPIMDCGFCFTFEAESSFFIVISLMFGWINLKLNSSASFLYLAFRSYWISLMSRWIISLSSTFILFWMEAQLYPCRVSEFWNWARGIVFRVRDEYFFSFRSFPTRRSTKLSTW